MSNTGHASHEGATTPPNFQTHTVPPINCTLLCLLNLLQQ